MKLREKREMKKENVFQKIDSFIVHIVKCKNEKKNVTIDGALRSRSIANWQQFCKNTPLNVCHL